MREGYARLRVDEQSSDLGVTTSGFYWHFKNREEFVHGLFRHRLLVSP